MTLFEVEELTRYWVDHPPLHLTIAAYLGVGKARSRQTASSTGRGSSGTAHGGDGRHLLAELGPSFVMGDVHAGLHSVVLDFAELRRRGARTD
jgi:hypothetical protein